VAPLLDTTIASSVARAATDPERARIAEGTADQPGRWWAFGPYVSERAWGTVREDYSVDGRAWEYFPHDHARSRAYRWSEDGLAVRRAGIGEPAPDARRPRVRASGNRHLCARLLGDHRRLRQGNSGRHLRPRECSQRWHGGGDAARAPDPLVSQSVVLGRDCRSTGDPRDLDERRRRSRGGPRRRYMDPACRLGARWDRADPALLRERDELPALLRIGGEHAVSEGWHQRPRGARRADGESQQDRHEDGVLVSHHGARRGNRGAPAAARTRGDDAAVPRFGSAFRAGADRPRARGRRLLRSAPHRRHHGRGGGGHASRLRRPRVEPAVLPLRRRALPRRRCRAADSYP